MDMLTRLARRESDLIGCGESLDSAPSNRGSEHWLPHDEAYRHSWTTPSDSCS